MRKILVTGSDTGVGKTRVVAALARVFDAAGERVQIVKVLETGRAASGNDEGDAACARRLSGVDVFTATLASFSAPLAPVSAALAEETEISFDSLVRHARALPVCDWCIFEGAGGIATPLDEQGRDWADFAAAVGVDATIVVVPDRLGAINQARLAFARAEQAKLHAGVWLNATAPVAAEVADSSRAGLRSAQVPVWAEQAFEATLPAEPAWLRTYLLSQYEPEPRRTPAVRAHEVAEKAETVEPAGRDGDFSARCRQVLAERERKGLRRSVRLSEPRENLLNLADNDYLALARDPALVEAIAAAAAAHGTSASASPLITGWRAPHARLVAELAAWHGFPGGLLWSSGYAANSAILGTLPRRGDLVLADRLVHHSMIAGLLRSGAQLKRYDHLCLDHLEELLAGRRRDDSTVFVVTETVFSMDGDYPDLAGVAKLKTEYDFQWIVDEAHALGWYGPEGAGLVRAAGVEKSVDVLVGTLGKTLASGGAYSLFRDETVRDYLVNLAGEFIYSTALSPVNAAVASAALARVKALSAEQPRWHESSRCFRAWLRAEGWSVPAGESPVVPVLLDDADAAVSLASALRESGVIAAAVRPPTVPEGTSRLRFSLKRNFTDLDAVRVLAAMHEWRASR